MSSSPTVWRFGDFEVRPGTLELRRGGEVLHLEPKVLHVLVYLLEHRDRVVEKSELLRAVWEETFVTENALTKAIGRLRQALDDQPQSPRYIQTVHTVGYRFVAEVVESGDEPRAGGSTRRRRWGALGAILLLAAAASLLLRPKPEPSGSDEEPKRIRSLAVLPLDNLTGDSGQDYLVDAMHEALIEELAQLEPLRVISRQSTLHYRETDRSMPEIARELSVDALVEGSVTRSAERVRVTAQIILGARDEHLWAGSFEGSPGDLLALLTEVSKAIGDEIQVALAVEGRKPRSSWSPATPEVEDLYLRGRYSHNLTTAAGFTMARDLFTRAIELDPDFAPAYAGLASCHFLLGFFGDAPREAAAAASVAAARAALELDPDLAEAWGVLGATHLYFEWDWEAAGRELERALALAPNNALIRHGYGDYLLAMGRAEESLEQVRLGRQYDPVSPLAVVPVVGHLLFAERHEEAVEEARALLDADPGMPLVTSMMAWGLWAQGHEDEALDVWRQRWERSAPDLVEALDRGRATGAAEDALRAVGEAMARADSSSSGRASAVAQFFAAGGDVDRAFEFLEKAVERREPQLLHVPGQPAFEDLRLDPRYRALLRRVGLPDESSR
jgi:TolB-like protein/DNA-binding winged helix-turn-helix (wHTH) protein